MDLVGHRGLLQATAAPPFGARGRVPARADRKDGFAVPAAPTRSGTRADLESVFRANYPLVVGVAARVLGSRDQAEDVAQDVFLSFWRSPVPAGEARGWLAVAAAHSRLNLTRSGKRRALREQAVGGAPVVPDVADAVVTEEERGLVRAALARLP